MLNSNSQYVVQVGCNSKCVDASFSSISTDSLCLQHAQMPTTRYLAIFVPTTTSNGQTNYFTPCASYELEDIPAASYTSIVAFYKDGGPDHRPTYGSVQLALLVMFKQFDFDMLVACRTVLSTLLKAGMYLA